MKVNEQQSKQLGNKTINVKKEEGKATAKKRSQKRKEKKKRGSSILIKVYVQSVQEAPSLISCAFPFQEKRRRKQSNAIIFFL
jgi:hypothetical protein